MFPLSRAQFRQGWLAWYIAQFPEQNPSTIANFAFKNDKAIKRDILNPRVKFRHIYHFRRPGTQEVLPNMFQHVFWRCDTAKSVLQLVVIYLAHGRSPTATNIRIKSLSSALPLLAINQKFP